MTVDMPQSGQTLTQRVAAEIRAQLGRRMMRQAELARRIGRTEQWVSVRLRGTQPIDLNDLEQVARALDLDPASLLPTSLTHRYVPVPERAGGDGAALGVQLDQPDSAHVAAHPVNPRPAIIRRRPRAALPRAADAP